MAVLLITFMAATTTLSLQAILVSSIITLDVYRPYIDKNVKYSDVIRWGHSSVVFFGPFSAGFSTALFYGGVDLRWTLYMLSILTCPGIFPAVFIISWRRQSKTAAVTSPILGLITEVAVWLETAKFCYGIVSIASTGAHFLARTAKLHQHSFSLSLRSFSRLSSCHGLRHPYSVHGPPHLVYRALRPSSHT